MKLSRRSLYRKLSRRFLLLLAVLSMANAALLWTLWTRLSDQQEQSLNWHLARNIAPQIESALRPEQSYEDLLAIRKRITEINPRITIYIIDRAGVVLANLNEQESVSFPQVDIKPIEVFLSRREPAESPIYGDDPILNDRKAVFSAAPIEVEGAAAYLYVVLNTFKRTSLSTRYVENSAMFLSILVALVSYVSAAGVGIGLLYLLTKRFQALNAQVESFRSGDYSVRAVVDSDDELGSLGATFNQMAEAISENIQKLEERDQIRRGLIADVSHDLRGPVAVIWGNLKRLEQLASEASNDALKGIGEVLRSSTKSLQGLLEQLFELARLEARERQVEPIPFALGELVGSLISAFDVQAAELAIVLRADLEDNLPLVFADINLTERALANLIHNAIRYTPSGGTVTLRCVRGGSQVRVQVIDTGPGFSATDISKIGQKFLRLDGSSPRSGESTGLGLSIVKRIVELQGSALELASTIGEGSQFSFTLPVYSNERDDSRRSG